MKIGIITIAIVGILITPVVSSFTTNQIKNNFTAIDGTGLFPDTDSYSFTPFGEHAVDAINGFFEFWNGTGEVIRSGWNGLLELVSTPTYTEKYFLNTGFNPWPQNNALYTYVKSMPDSFTAYVIVYDAVRGGYKDGTIFLGILMPLTGPWLTNGQMLSYKSSYGWPTQPSP